MPRTKKNLIKYQGQEKQEIRRRVANAVNDAYSINKASAYLDFYGDGSSYAYVKKMTKARILSIDSCPKIQKKMKDKPGTRAISLENLCKEGREKFNVIWLDWCDTLNDKNRDDLSLLHNIMMDKGTLFVTLKNGREVDFGKGSNRSVMEYGIHANIFFLMMANLIKINRSWGLKYSSTAKVKGKKRQKKTGMKVYKFTWERVETPEDFVVKKNDELLEIIT